MLGSTCLFEKGEPGCARPKHLLFPLLCLFLTIMVAFAISALRSSHRTSNAPVQRETVPPNEVAKEQPSGALPDVYCRNCAPLPPLPFQVIPGSVAFGTQSIGVRSQPMKITITNSNQEIEFKGISLVGGTSDFTLTNDCGICLRANKNCVITVTFIPSSKGAKSASTLIRSGFSGPTSNYRFVWNGQIARNR